MTEHPTPTARDVIQRPAKVDVTDLSPDAVGRSAVLMAKYADRPMDLAAATLVARAEERGLKQIFTLDDDFRIYRLHGRATFDTIPARRSRQAAPPEHPGAAPHLRGLRPAGR